MKLGFAAMGLARLVVLAVPGDAAPPVTAPVVDGRPVELPVPVAGVLSKVGGGAGPVTMKMIPANSGPSGWPCAMHRALSL